MRSSIKNFYYNFLNMIRYPFWFISKVSVGDQCRIRLSVIIRQTKIQNYCYIAQSTSVVNSRIGNYVSIGPNVVIGGAEHDYSSLSTSNFISSPKKTDLTLIGHDVWIGAGSVIRPGIEIGIGAVVGANSVVTRNIEPFEIVAGAPAKFIKFRFEKHKRQKIVQSYWWKLTPAEAKQQTILNGINGLKNK